MLQPNHKMRVIAPLIVFGFLLFGVAGAASAVDEKMLERMEQIIKQQQAQIEEQQAQNRAQAKAIENLQKQVSALSENVVKEATDAAKAEVAKASLPPDVIRSKGGDKVSLKVYGQVNRGVLIADDGDSSDAYFVDNANSSSRIGLLGDAKVNDDITVVAKMEFEYKTNPSDGVNQNDKNPDGSSFNSRWIDAQFMSKRFGTLYLGKGSTASDTTSERDLSGTDVIGYSSIADMSGGILFYDDVQNELTTTTIGTVFSNFDGLSRRNRIRYDSPEFMGFTAGGSLLSDGGDVSLKYATKWGEDWKFAAAIAYADPQAIDDNTDNQYNGSASILHSSGVNLTLAAGSKNLVDGLFNPNGTFRDDDPSFYYGKLGYRTKWFEIGESRFSADYMYSENLAQDNDEAKSFGIQMVQDFSDWGSELYLGYRLHKLDRDFSDYKDINSLMSGVRVKF